MRIPVSDQLILRVKPVSEANFHVPTFLILPELNFFKNSL